MTGVRIDKWLWAARFFKTRTLATEMVAAGHIRINGDAVKPARVVEIGDELVIRRGDEVFTVIVKGLAEKRGSAAVARTLFDETAASSAAREAAREQRRLSRSPAPDRRPDKRSRRHIIRFIRRED